MNALIEEFARVFLNTTSITLPSTSVETPIPQRIAGQNRNGRFRQFRTNSSGLKIGDCRFARRYKPQLTGELPRVP